MKYQKVPLTCVPFEGYQIDTNGRIFGRDGSPKKISYRRQGYVMVRLSQNGIARTYQLHRLVALQFIPNPFNKPTVNHKDGVRDNNNVSNLEWATLEEQQVHSRDVLLRKYNTHRRPIFCVNTRTETIQSFPSITNASVTLNIPCPCIHRVLMGKRNHANHFIFGVSEEDVKTRLSMLSGKRINSSYEVGQYTLNGELIRKYRNAYATREFGFHPFSVYKCCKQEGYHKTHRGFLWKFLPMPLSSNGRTVVFQATNEESDSPQRCHVSIK